MSGITAYGAYIPRARLRRELIGEALELPRTKGSRSVASYDEDTSSLGVEACRIALRPGVGRDLQALYFATSAPAYFDKANATTVHAALALDERTAAYDVLGSARSGFAALRAASNTGEAAIAVLSDIRSGLPGGEDESNGGDAAAAFVFADQGPFVAEVVAWSSRSQEYLDRWRIPGQLHSRTWEERFAEPIYDGLCKAIVPDIIAKSGLKPRDVTVVLAGTHQRSLKRAAAALGAEGFAVTPDLVSTVGNLGTAHSGVALANALDRAKPGEHVLLLSLSDGADALVLRAADAIAQRRPHPSVAAQIAAGDARLSYSKFLTWRGFLNREPPRRPDPAAPAAPAAHRNETWKFALMGSECLNCGTVQTPPQRVCFHCHAVDKMKPAPCADRPAKIVNFTIDSLAYTPSPPMLPVVVDFEGGGRLFTELADVFDPSELRLGQSVELTFRRLSTASNGIHNYFWKARPKAASGTRTE